MSPQRLPGAWLGPSGKPPRRAHRCGFGAHPIRSPRSARRAAGPRTRAPTGATPIHATMLRWGLAMGNVVASSPGPALPSKVALAPFLSHNIESRIKLLFCTLGQCSAVQRSAASLSVFGCLSLPDRRGHGGHGRRGQGGMIANRPGRGSGVENLGPISGKKRQLAQSAHVLAGAPFGGHAALFHPAEAVAVERAVFSAPNGVKDAFRADDTSDDLPAHFSFVSRGQAQVKARRPYLGKKWANGEVARRSPRRTEQRQTTAKRGNWPFAQLCALKSGA